MTYLSKITAAFIFFISLGLFLNACSEDRTIPKPPTFLRLDFEHPGYTHYQSNCGYSFDIDKMFAVKGTVDEKGVELCHKDIDLGKLNGIMYLSYITMDKPLKEYIDHALDKVDEHKVKASSISDTSFYFPQKRVFGTLFELKGNTASPFQFYLTDSTSKFTSAVVYFNTVPNYDSLRPSLEFLKKDIYRLIETFEWK
jgi:gliding motility-associated lipoprotein GldD